jgi:hypothetical protein
VDDHFVGLQRGHQPVHARARILIRIKDRRRFSCLLILSLQVQQITRRLEMAEAAAKLSAKNEGNKPEGRSSGSASRALAVAPASQRN